MLTWLFSVATNLLICYKMRKKVVFKTVITDILANINQY